MQTKFETMVYKTMNIGVINLPKKKKNKLIGFTVFRFMNRKI